MEQISHFLNLSMQRRRAWANLASIVTIIEGAHLHIGEKTYARSSRFVRTTKQFAESSDGTSII